VQDLTAACDEHGRLGKTASQRRPVVAGTLDQPPSRLSSRLISIDRFECTSAPSPVTCALNSCPVPELGAAQQDYGGIVFLGALTTKLPDGFHEPEDAAVVCGYEFCKARPAELLVVTIQRFGNAVSVEQQAEITAELHRVLGKLAGKQADPPGNLPRPRMGGRPRPAR
jgi:hypothetical protein